MRLVSWAVLHDLTDLNEAVVSFNVLADQQTIPTVLLVMVCPRRLQIMRIKSLHATGDNGTLAIDDLPGNLHDLAVSKVRSMFPAERAS